MSLAVCPGTFDPFHLGHLDVVRRATVLFDEVVVAVATNAAKSPMFDAGERVELARAALADVARVRVAPAPGLLVDFCREIGAVALVKGLRGGADFDAEHPMALMNRHLSGIETVYVTAAPEVAHVASSLVKDVWRHGGEVADLVPGVVAAALASRR